jgi:hypothetical protein
MRPHIGLAAALWLGAAAAGPSAAQPWTLTVNAGAGQVLDSGGGAEGGVEMAFAPGWLGIAPAIGGTVSEYGASYAYLGFRRDFPVGGRAWLTPFTGAGVHHRGGGIDLGGSLQFRSGLELAVGIGARQRLSLSLYHLSNAGLQRPNPGTESLVVGYSFTVGGGPPAGRP